MIVIKKLHNYTVTHAKLRVSIIRLKVAETKVRQ